MIQDIDLGYGISAHYIWITNSGHFFYPHIVYTRIKNYLHIHYMRIKNYLHIHYMRITTSFIIFDIAEEQLFSGQKSILRLLCNSNHSPITIVK